MTKTILTIEDNERNRMLMKDILVYRGYNVIEAANGKEGIEIAFSRKPDLIFLDMQMPVMDGFAALKELRSNSELNDIKIVAVTSFAMKGDREKILAAGADDYISKPIDTRALPELVKKYIG
ncbi:MAG: response regulator [bacterium]